MKLKLSRDLLYDKSNIKRIHTPYLHLPKDKILKIVEGLLKTDGSNLKELYFTNTSLQLIMQMRYLFLRLGILTSGSVKNNIGKSHITKSGREIITKQISYVLRIPKHPNLKSVITFKQDGQFFKYFEWNGILWGRIKSIKHINYEGPVYDFNMIDNHNYLTDTGLVHNSGKRKGSFSVYLETWHADIFEFLDLKKNQGHDNVRARDLFYAMWIPDLFMKRVEENGDWYLMCPDECPGLQDAYGDKFDRLYNGYVEENRYRKKIKAQDLWFKILEAQIETGTPYMLYKDSVNKKSNQREYGTIRSSNLCVRGDTLILTNTGYHPIEHLKDQNVGVWNGHEWSKVTVKQTGTGQQLLRVTLNDGSSLDCTDYHKFYDPRGNEIRAGDLVKGTELLSAKKFPIIREGTSSETQSVPVPYTFGLLDKDPPINCDLATKLRWLEGFFEGRRGLTFRYSADQLPFINQLRLFFNTLGVIPRIVQTQDSYWHVSIILRDIQLLTNLGLKRCPSLVAGTFNGTPRLIVTDIEKLPGTFDTFCFTEPLRGKGIFNGILTGQCSEITLYSDPNETAVCNLLSIALPKFVDTKKRTFNFEELKEVARYAVRGMNKVIDVNYYSTPESEYSNKKHRPIGLGIQGENDVFIMMRYPFESAEARQLNKDMFEAIYYGAVEGSIDMAEEDGPYSTYAGSPFSQGLLQFDLWAEHDPTVLDFLKESRWDWKNLKERMKKHGMRNSMLTTCMPTASTAQILGNTECMEPIDSCIFKRRVLSGDFTVINKHLVEDLMKLGLWSNEMKERIIIDNGSIQRIPEIPDDIKALYKTVWEISQKTLIDYSADRGPFIDHSQSLNLFVEKPTLKKLTSMHFYGWKKGLKTGMYYLRSKSAAGAAKFSVDATLEAKSKDAKYTEEEKLACSLANPEACEACSG
jgi:ribonucleotide reductase alpha subunit